MDSKIEPVAWTSHANLKVAKQEEPFYAAVMGSKNTPEMNVALYTGRQLAAALAAAEQRGRESEREQWHIDGSTPGIPLGTERNFIVAIRRARNGKIYSFPALYLNAFPLNFEDSEEWEKPTTGWFSAEANDDGDGSRYNHLHLNPGDEFLAWCEVPRFAADDEPVSLPIPGGAYRAASTLFNELKEKDNG